MIKNDLGDLASFAVVAKERSFTRAALELGITQSALSHTIRELEKRLGLQLLARTTRSVAPTAAGKLILNQLTPALEQIQNSLLEAKQLRNSPSGRLKIRMSRSAACTVLLPKLAAFTKAYPDIVLDVNTSDTPLDLVAGEFDAGILIGERLQRDMISVRVSYDLRLVVVGTPEYFQTHSTPKTPLDLNDHPRIGFRLKGQSFRWEFRKNGKTLAVNIEGPVVFTDVSLVILTVLEGVGLGMVLEDSVADLIASHKLIQVLSDWCPSTLGFYLYYPTRHHQPAALTALIMALRLPSDASSNNPGAKKGKGTHAKQCSSSRGLFLPSSPE